MMPKQLSHPGQGQCFGLLGTVLGYGRIVEETVCWEPSGCQENEDNCVSSSQKHSANQWWYGERE